MIKVITDAELHVLLRNLIGMLDYFSAHPESFLTRVVGIYSFKKRVLPLRHVAYHGFLFYFF